MRIRNVGCSAARSTSVICTVSPVPSRPRRYTVSPDDSVWKFWGWRGRKRRNKVYSRRKHGQPCRFAPSVTVICHWINIMTELSGNMGNTDGAKNACVTIDGSGRSWRRATRRRTIKRATSAAILREGLKLSTHIPEPKTTTATPGTVGRAIHAICAKDANLAILLLEGWRKGYLRLNPPTCCK